MRLLTDFQTALLLAVVIWTVIYFVPVLLDALFDPHRDRFDDVDELVREER